MWEAINNFLVAVDDKVWGVPLMVLIIAGGVLLTSRLGFLQVRRLPLALKWMFKNEEEGDGEISSFAALCTALSATIGTGNIVGVATAVCAGGPGALFWMIVAAFFGMATKFSEGLLAVKYRVVAEDGHSLGGPFYYIEKGMGPKWKWLGKIFAFFGVCVGLFGIGTFSQVNGISSAVQNFFDPDKTNCINIPFLGQYSVAVVVSSLILALIGTFFTDHTISVFQNFQFLYRCIKIEIYVIFHCIVQILKNDIVNICSQVTNRCIQKIQFILQAEFLEFGSRCGIKLRSLTAIFHVDIVNILHQLDCLALADMFVQSSTEIVGDVIFSIRECTCTAEAAHDGTSLTVDTVLYLLAVDRAFSLFKGVSLFENCHFTVRHFFH